MQVNVNGLISHSKLDGLLDRLELICSQRSSSNPHSNNSHSPHSLMFFEHEQVFSASAAASANSMVKKTTSVAGANAPPFLLRLRSNVLNDEKGDNWSLVHLGDPDHSKARQCTVRPVVQVDLNAQHNDPVGFVATLSPFTFSFELARKGKRFNFGDLLTIEVFQPYRVSKVNRNFDNMMMKL